MNGENFIHFSVILYRSKKKIMQYLLKDYNLNYFDGMLMLEVLHTPGVSQQRLAKIMLANESGVARGLRHLEKSAFINRQEDPDNRRRKLVFPTTKAKDFYHSFNKLVNWWNQKIFKNFSNQEIESLMDLLQRVENAWNELNVPDFMNEEEV
ncbi:MarR family winged helix-turn-helix transcriptional regulator [Bombilactobacillus thymidiniphilus]|uniref:MarR family winged helix-turn-helix transcriptional regulator n=1 Tax=Bombilactobacillus thymidiniphilus TaxID=2923363 RepID=A0ABY4PER9_9LACO|nr:MarR family winged helix-turn-helix transcriptional regulator [Bombilactobacillus thymidiniphilus]UQS84060.1 MarR family winged helix-turn-helix transcriptional regulator [Bombilactobacillus thymidiniphilus]